MAHENTAGSSYLASLRTTSASRPPEPAAASTALLPPGAGKTVASEKRRSPRYRCQGSVHLRQNSTGAATWATFTDISLHGIYVEAMATFPVGARLSLILEVNGFKVEARGEVRVVYPGLGMGLSFLALPEPDRERLRDLLKSLSQPSVILTPIATGNAMVSNGEIPHISDPRAALQAIFQFFEHRHILSQDEFLRILKKSQYP
jgi:hypothetical protein